MNTAELLWAGADAQARALRAGELTSRELVAAALARAHAVQDSLNPFRVLRDAGAAADAEAADRRLAAAGPDEAPLLGVPIAIKDDTDLAGEKTCYGVDPDAFGPVAGDGEMVRRLREAGAVVIGKTHVPELMAWPFTETERHGPTRNPWDPSRAPGGSSGGSAAAVAAGVVGVAHGSDGAGSIRIPSAWCGLVGLKPTRDLVPLEPLANDWHRMAHFGPLARDVASAARFLDACATSDGGYLASLDEPARTLRVAVSRHSPPGTLPGLGAAQRAALDRAVELLRAAGHQVTELDPRVPAIATEYVLARYLNGIHEAAAALPPAARLEARTRGMARLGG
ncbi:MAG TPA: amidase family protein, partial [Pseudonocardiaceae bacterium]